MNKPFFSVIVPTYERPQKLEACLDSLSNLDYPNDLFEVIIIDDGSATPPEHIVTEYSRKIRVRLIVQPHAGPAAARNAGAAEARGELLAFTDSDCATEKDWLTAMAAAFRKTPDAIIGGHTMNRLTDNIYSTASQLIIDYLYSYYNAEKNRARFLASNNIAVSAEIFHDVGGFDQSFSLAAAEDRELCDRWLFHGYQLVYAPEAIVYHAHSMNLCSFWRQHYNYGTGAFRFHKARKKRTKEKITIEPLLFYINLLRYPFSQVKGLKTVPLVTLMGISQIVNAMGFYRMKFFRPDQEGIK